MTHYIIERKFPKLTPGNDDDGREIWDADRVKRIGLIARVIDWKDVGSVSVVYRAIIKGYRLEDWRDDSEMTFATLSEAMVRARVVFPGLKTG